MNSTLLLGGCRRTRARLAARVSAGLFNLLGAKPRLGRTFTAAEDQQGRDAMVVIGDGLLEASFWRRSARARPKSDSERRPTSSGSCRQAFKFRMARSWVDWERTCTGCFNFGMIARLRPGVSPSAGRAELLAILEHVIPSKQLSAVSFQRSASHRPTIVT